MRGGINRESPASREFCACPDYRVRESPVLRRCRTRGIWREVALEIPYRENRP